MYGQIQLGVAAGSSAKVAVPPLTLAPPLLELLEALDPQPAAGGATPATAAPPASRSLRLRGNIITPSSWRACAPVMPTASCSRAPITGARTPAHNCGVARAPSLAATAADVIRCRSSHRSPPLCAAR